MDPKLCYRLYRLLVYVYAQKPGDMLKASIEDDEMLEVYLSARVVRRTAQLLNEVEKGTR